MKIDHFSISRLSQPLAIRNSPKQQSAHLVKGGGIAGPVPLYSPRSTIQRRAALALTT
jgi:hypothetical protein